jgi:glycerol-3-phosphate O-acyltransferase 1/2
VDPIKNSLKLFEKNNILECHLQENIKIYYLNEDYDNDTAINVVYESLSSFKWIRNID